MKTIKIPETVTLKNPDDSPILDGNGNPVTISFKSFVSTVLLIDPKFGKGMADILSAVEIKQKLSAATDTLELDTTDWERLKTVADEPSASYNPVIVMQLVDFLIAIKDAT